MECMPIIADQDGIGYLNDIRLTTIQRRLIGVLGAMRHLDFAPLLILSAVACSTFICTSMFRIDPHIIRVSGCRPISVAWTSALLHL